MKRNVPMWKFASMGLVLVLAAVQLTAQESAEKPAQAKKDYSESSIVKRMMAFNKKNDGKLTKEEVTDPRLHRLFDLADANKDGVVTKEELTALAAKMDAEYGQGGDKGFGCPKGPGGKGKKGFGGGPGGSAKPGEILSGRVQDDLKLTSAQKQKLKNLQKKVDDRLAMVFTDQQKQQLKDSGERGPGGFGGPGGGFGGPGGGGPRGFGGPPGGGGPGGP